MSKRGGMIERGRVTGRSTWGCLGSSQQQNKDETKKGEGKSLSHDAGKEKVKSHEGGEWHMLILRLGLQKIIGARKRTI